MKFKRVEHVAIAVKNMEKMRDIFENQLGIKMEYEEELPHYNTKLAMYPIGDTYLEVLESSSPTTETSKWIEEHGEGLFHIPNRSASACLRLVSPSKTLPPALFQRSICAGTPA